MFIINEKYPNCPWSVNPWFVFATSALAHRWIAATAVDGVQYEVTSICLVDATSIDWLLEQRTV